jgi:dipeptidyl aminopeptidase/acylaminoacyl peptidase
VVLPHGGPSARDEWGFDWLPQFLAARGYAVIQPNYRGSSGFGDGWQNGNGFRNWRTAIGDIADSARYLAKQGIADPNRIAILGWSYGGYAALQAAAVEPSLFKAVVAIAPVTDLGMLKGDFADYSSDRITREFIGSGVHIEEGSPLRQARRVQAPVLLVHGDKDLNVKVDHSRRMDAALRGAGRKSELIEFAGLDHQLEDSDARALMLTRIGTLLADTIGG